jgi:hypothetical protein
MTREDFIEKWVVNTIYKDIHIEDMGKDLDELLKQEAIGFDNWKKLNGYKFDENGFWFKERPRAGTGIRTWFTNEQLYELYKNREV